MANGSVSAPIVAAMVLALAATSASAGPPAPNYLTNYSGYIATGRSFTQVSMTYRQPAVQCTDATARLGIWVGFEGDLLRQDGTNADCKGPGQPPVYTAFWEVVKTKNGDSRQGLVITPNDLIEASVVYADDKVTMRVTDKTTGQHLQEVRPCDATCLRPKAEWIVERPGADKFPLANFGQVELDQVVAYGDPYSGVPNPNAHPLLPGQTAPDTSLNLAYTRIDMRARIGNQVLARTSGFNGTTGLDRTFKVTWVAEGPPAACTGSACAPDHPPPLLHHR